MQKISITFMITAIILLNPSSAETVKKYVEVCTENQKNKMGPELCECVGNKAKGKFSKEEFDFFYTLL